MITTEIGRASGVIAPGIDPSLPLGFWAMGLDCLIHHAGKMVPAQSRDLATRGISLWCNSAIPVGEPIEIEAYLVFDEGHRSEGIRLFGEVMWCTPRGDRFQIGAKFRPMAAATAQHVALFVDFLDATKAEREAQAKIDPTQH